MIGGPPRALLLRRASTRPGVEVDLAIVDGVIVPVDSVGAAAEVVDLEGRPTLPGLADHHLHLFAMAAARRSVDVSPGALATGGGLDAVLVRARRGTSGGWLRAVGYDVAATGPLDRDRLDATGAGPVRVQDRTGILWVLDSRALDEVLPADPRDRPEGVEVHGGRPTGVLRRLDHWLGHRVPSARPDLAPVGADLAATGLVAVTDAGAGNTVLDLAALAEARLPLRVRAMTAAVDVEPVDGVALGPVKVLLDDVSLPPLDDLAALVSSAHAAGRSVAVHCVTEVQLALALAAGIGPRDRVEHASLVPDDLLRALAAAGPQVVVQPGLVWSRGDRYLAETDPADHAGLHRLASFLAAGLRVAASSDAPFGPADPWRSIAAAVGRRTRDGVPLGPGEGVSLAEAVALHAGALDDPTTPRRLVPGAPADLVVLEDDWSRVADHPRIAVTALAGVPTHGAWPT